MALYCGIDLHSTNSYLVVLDEDDKVLLDTRVKNQLELVLRELEPFRKSLSKLAVESTYNWYWLADGLKDHGYQVELVNTCAAKQYEGLKFRDDAQDARWIAHMLRLGILPTGSIMPRKRRAIRDLLRRRMRVVRQKTTNLLQVQSQITNHTGQTISSARLKRLKVEELPASISDPFTKRAIVSALHLLQHLEVEVADIHKTVLEVTLDDPSYKLLRTIKGVGEVLAMTILYETGSIDRFSKVGNYASYCRCVSTEHLSDGKRKGSGNKKNGNSYLSWAFAEAGHFAIRFQPDVKRYYERKKRKTNGRIAASAVSHKLARAVYFMLRDQVPYRSELLFGAPS